MATMMRMMTTTTAKTRIVPEHKQQMRRRRRRRQIMRMGRKYNYSQLLMVSLSLLIGIILMLEQQEIMTVSVSVIVSAWTTTTPITTTMTRQRSISNRNRNTAVAESSSSQSSSILFRQRRTNNSNRNSNSGLFAIKDTKKKEADEDLISEMDARILQSMLRDNKLDLEQTSNMKKLLERGIKKDEKEIQEEEDLKKKQAEEEDTTEYSSEAIKKLANTKFWKAFQRNAAEVFESVGIAATNQLEKAAKVVVGLGFFAWERAKQDAARALPTSASIPKKKQVFQINDKSSYVEPKIEEEEPPPSPAVLQRTLREEFTTPADELSAVSAEIKKIFLLADQQVSLSSQDKSKDMKNPFFAAFVERKQLSEEQSSANGGNADRSSPFFASQLSTTTTRGGNARLESAYQRKKKTQLKQEKENIAKTGTRLMSATIDTAYQVKQEMKGETNIPGYKTKQIRESTIDLSKRIAGVAQGAAGLLGGASSFLLGNKSNDNNRTNGSKKQLPSATTGNNNNNNGNKIKAEPVEFLDDASYFAFSSPQSRERQREQQQQQQPNEKPEYITAEVVIEEEDGVAVVVDTKDSFDFFGSTINQSKVTTGGGGTSSTRSSSNSNTNPSTTNAYLDAIDTTRTTTTTAGGYVVDADDGLRQVTAEVVMDDDEDMDYASVFEQARDVDNISVEELLEEAAQQDKLENQQPNFVTKVTLRSLDVLFVVVEKGVVLVPDLVQGLQRAVIRVTESKLKDSSGSSVGWEVHASTIRGEQRY